MKIVSFGRTDSGKSRKNNEDSYLIDDGNGLYAVADGIGGHQGGEVASRLAVDTVAREVPLLLASGPDAAVRERPSAVDPCRSALETAFSRANANIRKAAAGNPVLSGMGTTLTALFFGTSVYLAHIGDSRAYRLKAGLLSQISEDNSVVAELVRAGLLPPEQARSNPYRHIITRALGIEEELRIELRKIDPAPDDTFLLCTDGLTDMVDDSEIKIVLQNLAPAAAAARLVDLANDHGGADNITVVVVKIEAL